MLSNIVRTLTAAALLAAPSFAADPPHVVEANALIDALTNGAANVNLYDGDGTLSDQIQWTGSPRTAISVCGTFVTMLMKHTYNWTDADYKTRTGSNSPNAAKYYDAILTRPTFFTKAATPLAMLSGDLLAVKYPAGSQTSGHVMVVAAVSARRLRNESTQNFLKLAGAEPNIDGYFDLSVIDSSASFHGPTDTRAAAPGGVGRGGVFRVYVDAANTVVGYTWSTVNGSDYKRVSDGFLVAMGRMN